jgi:mono/diheme cytochrome c family protein
MKKRDWTRLAEIAFGILATEAIVFSVLLYALKEPERLESAQSEILATQLDEAMSLYAENCTVCHGMAGEGIGSTPSLDNEGLRTMDYNELLKVISRGRYDTAMPAWNKSDGGPLSDYQVEELAALIQFGDWEETQNRVVNLGLAPLVPFSTEPDPVLYDSLAALEDGETLQQAITIFSTECVACHGADGLGTSLAPPLNDPTLRETPPDELNRIISLGVSGTLMAGWNSSLTQEEIDSLVTLITRWDEVELGAIPAPEVPIVTTEESILLGEALYASNCSMCHGPEGQGTRRAPALNVKGFLTQTPDQAIQQIIMQGVPGTAMPAWGDRMLESDIQAIVGFIRQWEATAPEVATPATMGRGGRGGGGGPPWANDSNWTPPGMSGSGEISQEELDALRAAEAAGGGHEEGAGGPPEGAGPPEGFGEEAGGHGGEETGMYGGAEGGVPPWAQEMEEPAWWETLDVRVWTLILGALALALLLIVIGYTALRRSPPPDNRS